MQWGDSALRRHLVAIWPQKVPQFSDSSHFYSQPPGETIAVFYLSLTTSYKWNHMIWNPLHLFSLGISFVTAELNMLLASSEESQGCYGIWEAQFPGPQAPPNILTPKHTKNRLVQMSVVLRLRYSALLGSVTRWTKELFSRLEFKDCPFQIWEKSLKVFPHLAFAQFKIGLSSNYALKKSRMGEISQLLYQRPCDALHRFLSDMTKRPLIACCQQTATPQSRSSPPLRAAHTLWQLYCRVGGLQTEDGK